MENNKLLILGSGATACLALGYLGLKYMGGEDISKISEEVNKEIEETKEIKEMKNKIKSESLYNSIEKEEEEEKRETQEEKTTLSEVFAWGNFWRTSYQDNKNEKIE